MLKINEQKFSEMDELSLQKVPFFFVIDYLMQKPLVIPLEEVAKHQIFYKIGDKTNCHFKQKTSESTEVVFEKYPISFEEYQHSFTLVQNHLKRGDSFLVNLTKPTPIRVKSNGCYSVFLLQSKYFFAVIMRRDGVCE